MSTECVRRRNKHDIDVKVCLRLSKYNYKNSVTFKI